MNTQSKDAKDLLKYIGKISRIMQGGLQYIDKNTGELKTIPEATNEELAAVGLVRCTQPEMIYTVSPVPLEPNTFIIPRIFPTKEE